MMFIFLAQGSLSSPGPAAGFGAKNPRPFEHWEFYFRFSPTGQGKGQGDVHPGSE